MVRSTARMQKSSIAKHRLWTRPALAQVRSDNNERYLLHQAIIHVPKVSVTLAPFACLDLSTRPRTSIVCVRWLRCTIRHL